MNGGETNDDEATLSHPLGNIEDYSLAVRLGRGKYSNVFQGIINETEDYCVVKILKPVHIPKIFREIKILDALKGGPYISQIIDVVQDNDSGSYAIVLNWAENNSLREVVHNFEEIDVKIYMGKLFKALEYAHSKNIMHRDIKPGNLMYDILTKDLSVIDWGLADFYEKDKNYPVRVGTKHFKGPELLFGIQNYNPSVDMWAAGCTLASILFQKFPFFTGNEDEDQIVKICDVLGGKDMIYYTEKYQLPISTFALNKISKMKHRPWSQWINQSNQNYATDTACDLLDKLLIIDHKTRLTPTRALKHKFFDEVRDLI